MGRTALAAMMPLARSEKTNKQRKTKYLVEEQKHFPGPRRRRARSVTYDRVIRDADGKSERIFFTVALSSNHQTCVVSLLR
jgi:hypothetical protein